MVSLSPILNVDGEFEHVVEHPRNVGFQQLGALFQTRIRVHFEEPGVVGGVNHEVVPEQLKTRPRRLVFDELAVDRLHCQLDQGLDLGHNCFLEARRILGEGSLGLRVRKLVPIFERPVVVCELLHGVVGEMNLCSLHRFVVEREVLARGSDVAF
jgi:hypothetical protein